MKSIVFLSVEDVLVLHGDTMSHEGGLSGIRDHGLLDAAVAMPRQQFSGEYLHPNLPAMAAAYLYHLAQNHPFHDGNKRVAVMAAYVFLDANGMDLKVSPSDLEAVTRGVASGEMKKDEIIEWMGRHAHPRTKRS
ncbi:MAG: type II toxin-antitoxin system death-on-curing family toxin [Nitrospiraceae bacterium]